MSSILVDSQVEQYRVDYYGQVKFFKKKDLVEHYINQHNLRIVDENNIGNISHLLVAKALY